MANDTIYGWSQTVADNADADDIINWRENQAPSTVNDSARGLMKRVADYIADQTPTARANSARSRRVYGISLAPPVLPPGAESADGLLRTAHLQEAAVQAAFVYDARAYAAAHKRSTPHDNPRGVCSAGR